MSEYLPVCQTVIRTIPNFDDKSQLSNLSNIFFSFGTLPEPFVLVRVRVCTHTYSTVTCRHRFGISITAI